MNKYKNVFTSVDNIEFSSKMEANVYEKLSNLKATGLIKDLVLQPKFLLQESFPSVYYDGKKEKIMKNKIREINYISDFTFIYKGKKFVLEVKGMMDQKYPIKKKIFLNKFGNEYFFMEIRRIRELKKLESIMDELLTHNP